MSGPQGATGVWGPSGPSGPQGVRGETGAQALRAALVQGAAVRKASRVFPVPRGRV